MPLDKSRSTEKTPEIAFNWERTKKQATKKLSELVCNSPKISRREEVNALKSQTERLVRPVEAGAERTTDTTIDPPTVPNENYTQHTVVDDCIVSQECHTPNGVEPSQNSGNDFYTNTDRPNRDHIANRPIDNDIQANDTPSTKFNDTPSTINDTPSHKFNDTPSHKLLAAVPPPGRTKGEVRSETREVEVVDNAVVEWEKLGPDTNAIDLLQQIKKGDVSGKELSKDERIIVVKALRMAGQTQDSISSFLGISRRTVVNDCRELRRLAALEIQNTETAVIAGEVYSIGRAAINKALQKGHLKSVSTLMKDMVELLQSMGMVYRAPKTSMQAQLHGSMERSKGYQKYISTIGDDSDKVVEVLDCMFNAISDEKI